MRLAGFLLLLAGWFLTLTALAILGPGGSRSGFVLAGFGVEILGLILTARAHRTLAEETE
jgi:hypothetical protein